MISRRFWLFCATAVLALACGGAGADSPHRPLPPWEGHQTELFDDAIDPRAVGLNLDTTRTPQSDPLVRERTQVGDAVVRARVDTVTERRDGDDVHYQLGFHVLETLTGAHPPPKDFVIRFDKGSPSTGIMRSLDERLGGKTFVVFLREFEGPDNEPRYYVHLSPDTKDVVAAVNDAVALSEFKQ